MKFYDISINFYLKVTQYRCGDEQGGKFGSE